MDMLGTLVNLRDPLIRMVKKSNGEKGVVVRNFILMNRKKSSGSLISGLGL